MPIRRRHDPTTKTDDEGSGERIEKPSSDYEAKGRPFASDSSDFVPPLEPIERSEDRDDDDDDDDDDDSDDGEKVAAANDDEKIVKTKKKKKSVVIMESLKHPVTVTTKKEKTSVIDSFLSSYVTFTSSALNQDRSLKFLQYALWFLSVVTKKHPHQFHQDVSPGLRKMYFDLSMARYALRLFGMPSSLEAIRTGSWGGAASGFPNNKKIDQLGQVMAWSMLFYYPLEHVAYGNWVAPKLVKGNAEKYTAYSCRFWLTYIVADMAQSVLKLRELGKRRKLLLENHGRDGASGTSLTANEIVERRKSLDKAMKLNRLQIIRSILFTLPAIHWSLPKWERDPWLKDSVVNGLMLSESIVCMYQSIFAMQKP